MPDPADEHAPPRPYLSLRHRDFRRLWATQLVSLVGSQMQVTALHWHVYLLTGSPLALGMVGLTRVIPVFLFSLWGGVAADRFDRRKLLFLTQSGMTVIALALALLTFARRETLGLIYLLNALSATASSFDNPARQSLVPRLVPRKDLPGALSLNLTAFHVAMIAGPALSGFLIAGGSAVLPGHGVSPTEAASFQPIAWIYLLNGLSFLGVLGAIATLRTSGRVDRNGAANGNPVADLHEGLRFVFRTPIMVWTMWLDFFATFFSGAMSLLPIFADKILGVGASGYGLLVAAPGLGALAGALYTSAAHLPRKHGPLLLWSVAAYGASTVVFGFSRSFVLTFAALLMSGLADLVSTVIRQTLRQLITPDHLRGRMTSVNMMFFMGGPQLGEVEAGLVASLFASVAVGATVSVVSGGLATIVATGVIAAAAPLLRRYRVDDIDRPQS